MTRNMTRWPPHWEEGQRYDLSHVYPFKFDCVLPASQQSADFCRPVRTDRSALSRGCTANDRSPEVSSTAFRTQPPDLHPACLMNMDFVVLCPLVPRAMPRIGF